MENCCWLILLLRINYLADEKEEYKRQYNLNQESFILTDVSPTKTHMPHIHVGTYKIYQLLISRWNNGKVSSGTLLLKCTYGNIQIF
jgi:hypothetical protein